MGESLGNADAATAALLAAIAAAAELAASVLGGSTLFADSLVAPGFVAGPFPLVASGTRILKSLSVGMLAIMLMSASSSGVRVPACPGFTTARITLSIFFSSSGLGRGVAFRYVSLKASSCEISKLFVDAGYRPEGWT